MEYISRRPDSHFHYALAVRCPRLDMPVLRRGLWTLMYMTDDREDITFRFNAAKNTHQNRYIELVVFQISKNDIGAVRVAVIYGVPRIPAMKEIHKVEPSLQRDFWQTVKSQLASPPPSVRPPVFKPKVAEPSGLGQWVKSLIS